MGGNIKLSENARIVAENRYFMEGETWQDCAVRVGTEAGRAENGDSKSYSEKFSEMIYEMDFLPGGRILRNTRRARGSLFNCYVLPIGDSIEEIGQFMKDALILWSEGGGVGCNFSYLRPRGTAIKGKGGTSSGPVSFLESSDAVANTIESGGSRRAAALACMHVSHPDILEFIDAKLTHGKLSHYNISVAVDDAFLGAVEANKDWQFKFAQQNYGTVPARDIWDKIIQNMVNCAEPGLLNWKNLQSNNSYYFDPILCFTGDTLISTVEGLIPIKELVDKKINIISDLRTMNSQGTFIEKGLGFKSGIKEVFEVRLKNNQSVKLTAEHKVWTNNGWVMVKDLKINGDFMYVQNSISQHFVNDLNNESEFDNGYFVGLLVGDGWLCKNGKSTQYGFCFNSEETDMMNFVSNKLNELSKRKVNWRKSSNGCASSEITSSSQGVVDYFNKWGYCCEKNEYGYLSGDKKSSKFISDEVLRESPSFKKGFISGLYAADGHIQRVGKGNTGKNKKITLVTSKKHVAERLQIMLNEFGIPSTLGSRISTLNNKKYKAYTINISRVLSCMVFKKLIECRHSKKDKELNNYKFGSTWNEKYYGMFKVKSIKSLGEQEVYDVESSVTHSLIANGIVVHNSTNPCGEVPLGSYGVCNLGSIVLPNFVKGRTTTNWKKMEHIIKLAVRFLDNVIDINKYVLKEIDINAHNGRRVGVGVMGLAEYLFAKKLRYGSKEAIFEIERLMRFIRDVVYEASIELAVEKGAFPKFDPVNYGKAHFVRTLPAATRMSIKKHGIRNVSLMAVAPTGTISLLPEATSGIEPLFRKAYLRSDRVSDRMYVHPVYEEALKDNKENEIKEWFVDTDDLKPADHFETQAMIQKYVDGALSKTINLPVGTTTDELSALTLEYINDLKGVTVYVDGSRDNQILNKVTEEEVKQHLKDKKEISKDMAPIDCASGYCDI